MSGRNDDLDRMVREDIDAVRSLARGGVDTSVPVLLELGLASLTGLVLLCWLLALLWVPDPIPGDMWMAIGMLGLVLFGLPAGTIYVLRRGGADVVRALVTELVR